MNTLRTLIRTVKSMPLQDSRGDWYDMDTNYPDDSVLQPVETNDSHQFDYDPDHSSNEENEEDTDPKGQRREGNQQNDDKKDQNEQPDEDDKEEVKRPGINDDEDEKDGKEKNPNKAGIIRKVKGAHLVYKRVNDQGTYDELWIYKTKDDVRDELKVRRDILAGTDIPANKTVSDDGEQGYELWTVGNVQFCNIEGLPN